MWIAMWHLGHNAMVVYKNKDDGMTTDIQLILTGNYSQGEAWIVAGEVVDSLNTGANRILR